MTAHAEWQEASTPHFVVYSDDSAENVRAFATKLERFDKALRVLRNVPEPPVPKAARVTVYVLDSIGEVQELSRGSKYVAGFYRPRASGSMAFTPRWGDGRTDTIDAQTILLHEYTHHFMFTTWPNAVFPEWFVEGYAELHSTALFPKDGSVVIGAAAQHRARALLDGDPLPVEQLLVAHANALPDRERRVFYGRSWLLAHFLAFDTARSGQFARYIDAINAGQSPQQAATAFGDLKVLQRELDGYLRRRQIDAVTIAAAGLSIGPVTIRTLGAGEAATMAARIQTKRGVDRETAPGVQALARKGAAPFANDPAAQIELAEAELDMRDLPAAEAAADRAIAADANAIDAWVAKARVRMAVARSAKDTRPETWRDIRRLITTANRIDPDATQPLILFYASYDAGGQAPTPSAMAGLDRAFQLAPQDPGLRMMAVRRYLRVGKAAEARALLQPLAYNPHGGTRAQRASALIETIDRDGAPAALRQLLGKDEDD